MQITQRLAEVIRTVPDFPIPGIMFRDISPIFLQPTLVEACIAALAEPFRDAGITKVIGIDSRGFLLGPQLAGQLDVGFVMVRKKGKLPPETISVTYQLEYGEATLESVRESLQEHDRVLIHDDLLATGGTAAATAKMVQELGATVAGFNFIVGLPALEGHQALKLHSPDIHTLIDFA